MWGNLWRSAQYRRRILAFSGAPGPPQRARGTGPGFRNSTKLFLLKTTKVNQILNQSLKGRDLYCTVRKKIVLMFRDVPLYRLGSFFLTLFERRGGSNPCWKKNKLAYNLLKIDTKILQNGTSLRLNIPKILSKSKVVFDFCLFGFRNWISYKCTFPVLVEKM